MKTILSETPQIIHSNAIAYVTECTKMHHAGFRKQGNVVGIYSCVGVGSVVAVCTELDISTRFADYLQNRFDWLSDGWEQRLLLRGMHPAIHPDTIEPYIYKIHAYYKQYIDREMILKALEGQV